MRSCSPMTSSRKPSVWKIRIDRRPGEGRDPYAAAVLLARWADGFLIQLDPVVMGPGLRRTTLKNTSASSTRRERFRPRQRPGVAKTRIAGAVDQLAREKRRIELHERFDLGRGGALRKMDRPQFLRMFEARRGEKFRQRMQGGVMIIID